MRMQILLLSLLILIGTLAFIASVIVLIIGLARNRRRMWGRAIVAMAASVVLLLGSGAWGAVIAWHKGRAVVREQIAKSDAEERGSPELMREWYQSATQERLSSRAVFVDGRLIDDIFFTNIFLKFRLPAADQKAMLAHFDAVSWDEARKDLTTPDSKNLNWRPMLPFWDMDQIHGKTYYQKLLKDAQGHPTFNVTFCIDPDSDVVYFMALEVRD